MDALELPRGERWLATPPRRQPRNMMDPALAEKDQYSAIREGRCRHARQTGICRRTNSPRVFGHARKPVENVATLGSMPAFPLTINRPFRCRSAPCEWYVGQRGWTIAPCNEKEIGSGASQRQLREKLMEAARRREIDVVLVWRLDRWGRSVADLLATLQELAHLGVGFVSLTQALDLKATPVGNVPWPRYWQYSRNSEREILRERVCADRPGARQARTASGWGRLAMPPQGLHADKVQKAASCWRQQSRDRAPPSDRPHFGARRILGVKS